MLNFLFSHLLLFRAIRLFCYGVLALILTVVLTIGTTNLLTTPETNRIWSTDQAILPSVEFNKEYVTIRNIRNFSYTSTSTYTPQYYDKTFNISELVSVDFIVEPLKPKPIAHTLVSFGFQNGEYLAISVEIRKEAGELFSPLKGLFNQFELMYVIADERDLLTLRALHRKDELFLYRTKATKEMAQQLFVDMLTRSETLTREPEFYNTLTNTCTTNIVDHVNNLKIAEIPWDMSILLPYTADEYAYELGLLDTSRPFETLRAMSQINEAVARFENDPHFSERIRGIEPDTSEATPVVTEEMNTVTPDQVETPLQDPRVVTPLPLPPVEAPVKKVSEPFSKDAMLSAHNAVRKEKGVPLLTWSPTLEASAKVWAMTLKSESCTMRHDPQNSTSGENLYWSWSTGGSGDTPLNSPTQVVEAWADEEVFYNYEKNTCKAGEQCGHYTQIVWRDTSAVGCAVETCNEGRKQTDIWVCRYNPPGNFIGEQPY